MCIRDSHIGDPIADKQEGMDERDIEKQILKQLRMNGLVNSELDIIRHLDREIEKESDVIPVAIKDGYVQESRSSVASTRRFQDLRRFVNRRLREAGQDILMGNVDLKPYKQGNRTACDYCPYHAAVSYTHLDVYKRQALRSLPWRRNRAVGNRAVRSWEP